jgi:hypothetical protein
LRVEKTLSKNFKIFNEQKLNMKQKEMIIDFNNDRLNVKGLDDWRWKKTKNHDPSGESASFFQARRRVKGERESRKNCGFAIALQKVKKYNRKDQVFA